VGTLSAGMSRLATNQNELWERDPYRRT
jgi:hypothetical protein